MSASDLKCILEMERELGQYKPMYAELAHENFAFPTGASLVARPGHFARSLR